METNAPRTSDSDLGPLWSQEIGAKVSVELSDDFALDLSYLRYTRSNDLSISIGAIGYTMRL